MNVSDLLRHINWKVVKSWPLQNVSVGEVTMKTKTYKRRRGTENNYHDHRYITNRWKIDAYTLLIQTLPSDWLKRFDEIKTISWLTFNNNSLENRRHKRCRLKTQIQIYWLTVFVTFCNDESNIRERKWGRTVTWCLTSYDID